MGGQVCYIVVFDYEYYIFMLEWVKVYFEVKFIGFEGLFEKCGKVNDFKIGSEDFVVVFKKQGKWDICIDLEFDVDFEYEYVDGYVNFEFVFFYKLDKVFIEVDFLFNFFVYEQYSKVFEVEKKEGIIGKMFFGV